MDKKRAITLILWGCLAFFILLTSYSVYTASPISQTTPLTYDVLFHDNWTQIIGDEKIPLDNLQNFQSVSMDESLVFETVLGDNIHSEYMLYFYTMHKEVWVYLEDELVYSFEMAESLESLDTPGNTWHSITLSFQNQGQTLRVELFSPVANYHNVLHDWYLIHESQVNTILLNANWFRLLISFSFLFLGITSLLNGYIWRKDQLQAYIVSLGWFYLCGAFWLLAEVGALDFFFHRPVLSFFLSMIFMRMMPIAAFHFVYRTYPVRHPVVYGIGILSFANLFIPCFLQFFTSISFADTMWVSRYIIMGFAGAYTAIICYHYFSKKTIRHKDRPYLLGALIFLGPIVDIMVMTLNPRRNIMFGLATAITFGVFTISAHIKLVHHEFLINQKKKELEAEYSTVQHAVLMEQIKAHFFFNTLNTISALCKEDVRRADHAINLLARYMRTYMHLCTQPGTIALADELDLVETYLEIEQLRFGAKFTFDIDVEDEEAEILPLSIQPLVENAVNHGVRHVPHQGCITIHSIHHPTETQVIVADNGIGFDTAQLEHCSRVGIANVKKRLHLIGGSLELNSTPNVGTTITLTIPNSKGDFIPCD